MPARPQQILQCLYRVPIRAILNDGPRADRAGHGCAPERHRTEDEIYQPWTEKDHSGRQVATIVKEPDVDRPRNRHVDLNFRTLGTDVDDNYSG